MIYSHNVSPQLFAAAGEFFGKILQYDFHGCCFSLVRLAPMYPVALSWVHGRYIYFWRQSGCVRSHQTRLVRFSCIIIEGFTVFLKAFSKIEEKNGGYWKEKDDIWRR